MQFQIPNLSMLIYALLGSHVVAGYFYLEDIAVLCYDIQISAVLWNQFGGIILIVLFYFYKYIYGALRCADPYLMALNIVLKFRIHNCELLIFCHCAKIW